MNSKDYPQFDIQEVCDNLSLSELKKFAQRLEEEFYHRLEEEQNDIAERQRQLDEVTKDLK